VTSLNNITNRLLTVLVIVAIPVLCVSVWRMGGDAVDKYHGFALRKARRTLVDSILHAGSGRVVRGGAESGRTYLEIVDYQCPYCRHADSLLQLPPTSGNEIRVIALQLPLTSIHPLAERAAVAAVCSARQGVFSSFHHKLYSGGIPELPDSMWHLALASGAKDSAAFVTCLTAPETLRNVERESRIANRLGAVGTPTFVDTDGNQVPLERVVNPSADILK
jgi:protein-disulfide isomerase